MIPMLGLHGVETVDYAALAAVLAAVGGILKISIDALRSQRKDFQEAISKENEVFNAALTSQRADFQLFLTNHMSRHTAALERVADRLERVETQMNEIRFSVNRHQHMYSHERSLVEEEPDGKG